MAQSQISNERTGHTLSATALVHELYIRVIGTSKVEYTSRKHFFIVAAEAMRRVLLDHARTKNRAKRGGGRSKISLDALDLASSPDAHQIVNLDEAIQRLEGVDSDAAQVVRLRFYAGLNIMQIADTLQRSESSIKRDWAFARASIHRFLEEQDA